MNDNNDALNGIDRSFGIIFGFEGILERVTPPKKIHRLKINSLNDAQAECTGCGWHYLATGERTKKEVQIVWIQSHRR